MPLYKRQELEPHMNRSQATEIISFPPEILELAPHNCQSAGFIPLRSRHQLKSLTEPQGDKNDQEAIKLCMRPAEMSWLSSVLVKTSRSGSTGVYL